ncbi:hypothetical protein [Sporichthya sp.]|uniref:hypothetical protein n=1 Tax=Sporichthya sp. TaxID=65475 RepID=UPI0017A7DA99|nr:hypothetical protein [Sporichthya sp.]MBA3742313.1 hypothetical protein [Sporichthya sp.]
MQMEKDQGSEVWQARIGHELAAELRSDAELLGLSGRTEIVKAGLAMLHRHAAEERMARGVAEFYGGAEPPLPLTVADDDGPAASRSRRKRANGRG